MRFIYAVLVLLAQALVYNSQLLGGYSDELDVSRCEPALEFVTQIFENANEDAEGLTIKTCRTQVVAGLILKMDLGFTNRDDCTMKVWKTLFNGYEVVYDENTCFPNGEPIPVENKVEEALVENDNLETVEESESDS